MAEFRTELALIQHLHHPHVVQFLGVMRSTADGSPLLVTEFMELGSLADWFKKPTGVAPHVAIDLCLDCCRGMTYLHGRSPNPVLHRDLKPNNLMITVGMRLKIGDFGLSKTLSVRNRLPQDMSQAYKLTGETGSYRFMVRCSNRGSRACV
jgi:serine/threonine protein kinase